MPDPNNEAGGMQSKPRVSANRTVEVVLRRLRGEFLEDATREVEVEPHRRRRGGTNVPDPTWPTQRVTCPVALNVGHQSRPTCDVAAA